jgi:GxxExxY protein
VKLDAGYRIDMVIDHYIIIENKAVERILPIHEAQIMTYMRLSSVQIGFILNWNVELMKHGIKRFVNKIPEPAWRTKSNIP